MERYRNRVHNCAAAHLSVASCVKGCECEEFFRALHVNRRFYMVSTSREE